MIEKAIFIKHPSQLKAVTDEYQRLYFGDEFCERKISITALKELLQFASEKNISFTFVTPFVTPKYFDQVIEAVITVVNSNLIKPEIVVNDWGLFYEVRNIMNFSNFLLGRLLNKQKKGPEILDQIKTLNKNTLDHFRRATTDNPYFHEFLIANGFSRIEMDNLLCGILRKNSIPASLYFPFAYISVTRACKLAGCEGNNENNKTTIIRNCRYECEKFEVELEHNLMPIKLHLKGNTHLLRNDIIPENLEELNIDRLVYIPEL